MRQERGRAELKGCRAEGWIPGSTKKHRKRIIQFFCSFLHDAARRTSLNSTGIVSLYSACSSPFYLHISDTCPLCRAAPWHDICGFWPCPVIYLFVITRALNKIPAHLIM